MPHEAKLSPLVLCGRTIDPPLLLAPMAGITHAAFRRLVSGFGGYGALFTEMLPAKAILKANPATSPHTKRRPEEGRVFYQLLLSPGDDTAAIVERLRETGPFALDVNLACPAPEVVRYGSGAALFRNGEGLGRLLGRLRGSWPGILTVKIRLGDDGPQWRETLLDRLRIFEQAGVDAVIVHPRFFDEKLKRRARWEVFEWLPAEARLPLIGNGDIATVQDVRDRERKYPAVRGLMAGRIAVAQPWFFRACGGTDPGIDYLDVWERFFRYVAEDFPRDRRLGKIKEFSSYYARSFFYGHELFRRVQSAGDLDTAHRRATGFLARGPRTVRTPALDGL
jgi:tRNA-dihydrouridine synthase